ncbi:MAG: cobaltochelatase subunit CobN [Candidatus Methanomethylophilaceae archaeon]|nr:cobaltochelatase subunit CobN [Candidatus Methanomethylophilaceae archaeon]
MRYVNISIGTSDSYLMNRAVADVIGMGYDVDYRNFDGPELDEDPLLLAEALGIIAKADFVTIKVHGDTSYCKKFDRIEETLTTYRVCAHLVCTDRPVTEKYRPLFLGSDPDYDLVMAYSVLGGEGNFRGIVEWALNRFGGHEIPLPEPEHPLTEGIYMPGSDDHSIPDFIGGLDRSKVAIGIFFHQKQWTNGNTDHIDGLIRAVQELGASPVPLFFNTQEDKIDRSKGIKRLLDEDLTRDGEPVLDCIINTMSFSQTLIATPGAGEQVSEDNFYMKYGVPVLQAMILSSSKETWADGLEGLSPSEVAYSVAHPEFDGQIITVPCSSTETGPDNSRCCRSISDRALRIADMAIMWGRLRRKANRDRKVAILLYQYPAKSADMGGASGLDTFASVVNVLRSMRERGYDVGDHIPEDSEELVGILQAGLTNDTQWLSDGEVRKRSVDLIPPEQYDVWYRELSEKARDAIDRDWGKPPGDVYTSGKDIIVPGTVFGNILVGFQPDRSRNLQADYHDPNVVHPHQYYAYYKWLRHDFGADAVIHVGTHGTLEWLPGKAVALGEDCCPDYILASLPDIYPYIIGNPGEGTQAKRRSAAVIVDHMIPSMARSGSYDDILELEGVLQNYMAARTQMQTENQALILGKIREVLGRMGMFDDARLSPDCTDEELDGAVDRIYDYVIDIKENLIKDGLHILGDVPEGKRLQENVYSMVRVDNGEVPSLRRAIAESLGYDILDIQNNPSQTDGRTGLLKGQVLEDVETRTESLIESFDAAGFHEEDCLRLAEGYHSGDVDSAVSFICGSIHPNLMRMGDEISSVMDALEGKYIEPGPSGCPTRGRAQILPTGRNFYSLDPDSVPWHSSWEIGRHMADQMIQRYVDEHGAYPRNIGIVMWATDTMKTGGDDTAYVLWLLGIRPVWTGYAGRVKDLEVIPVSELGRPRIDVTLRISGLFRDTFPNLVRMIDRAVQKVMGLDESEEENYILANLRRDIVLAIEEGIPEDRAREDAAFRIFGDAPGTYGAGSNILVSTSDWQDRGELGLIYRNYGEYAYGVGRYGDKRADAFRHRLMSMDVTVKNSVSREYDMFDNDDVYTYLGGLNAAVMSVKGEMPESMIGFSADTSNLKTRTIDEEGRYIFRSKINNPKWVEGLKPHGFKGAQEISKMTEYVFGWDATSDIIEGWEYKSIAENFLFDRENAEWFRDANPYAMMEVVSRLLEAIGRGMWDADEDMKRRLQDLYEDLEGDLEGLNDSRAGLIPQHDYNRGTVT